MIDVKHFITELIRVHITCLSNRSSALSAIICLYMNMVQPFYAKCATVFQVTYVFVLAKSIGRTETTRALYVCV